MSKPKNDISVGLVRSLLSYDPETGALYWKVDVPPNVKAGQIAGGPAKDGYWRITIRRRTYVASRLAWIIKTGEWPQVQIDHVDTCKSNNRWINLREATPTQNLRNTGRSSANSSGYKGVSNSRSGWKATIKKSGKNIHLGHFATAMKAANAYRIAARKMHGDFLHASLR